ncbi:PREDICTED: mitochondrial ribonuclease P protein 3 [Nanorana parkeri]|uniref:mitochondrial ribonuclease P protein 3 n=1 Tax=Nanorana parkeri TaxID=125878 RepID=UPI000854389D|nr:PREDICTED: mitochondrial ribonuclease P protein 3 [Nanorana parkeri]
MGTSVFAAGSAKRRSLGIKDEEPRSTKQGFTPLNTMPLTLPTEPLGSDGWSQLKEKSNCQTRYEDRVLEGMLKMNTDLEIAKSFLSFVAEKDGDISYRFLVKYLVLCVQQNQGAEVCDVYDIMRMKFQSFDTGASSLFIRGLGKTDRWRESIAILETMRKGGSVSARNYADCVKAAIGHQERALAFTLYDEMVQNKMLLPEDALQSLFDASQDLQDDDYRRRLISILSYFRENQIYPGEVLMKSIKSWFESIPNEFWRGKLTKVTNGGHCQACNEQIESIHLTPEEYSILKKAVIDGIIKGEDTFRKTTPQELQAFLQFVNSRPPYDIVVDGLNVAYNSKKGIFSQTLLDVVSCLKAGRKRILVLGRKHMLVHSKKWVKQDIQRLQEYADCFFLDNISLDDPFLLYASINSGNHCCFLTQDLLRDHKACLPDAEIQRLFFKWQRGHQLVMPFYSPGNVRLQPVLSYDTIVQSTDTSYHIPYDRTDVVRTSFEVPKTWLCLKKEQ